MEKHQSLWRPYQGLSAYGIFGEKIIGIWDIWAENQRDSGYLKKILGYRRSKFSCFKRMKLVYQLIQKVEKKLSNEIFTFCHQILSILAIGANIGSFPRTTLPFPHGFSHFAPLSRLLIALKSTQSFSNSLQIVT